MGPFSPPGEDISMDDKKEKEKSFPEEGKIREALTFIRESQGEGGEGIKFADGGITLYAEGKDVGKKSCNIRYKKK